MNLRKGIHLRTSPQFPYLEYDIAFQLFLILSVNLEWKKNMALGPLQAKLVILTLEY